MRQISKKIQTNNANIQELDNTSKDILTKIKSTETTILISKNEIKNLIKSISDCTFKINDLTLNFEISIFQRLIELFSLGIINHKREHLANIEEIKTKKQNLLNTQHGKEKDIAQLKNVIGELQLRQSNINANINQLKLDITLLTDEFNKKLNLFKIDLLSIQTKLITLAKTRYINDYTKNEILLEFGKIIVNQEEFLEHIEIKKHIDTLIQFHTNTLNWVNEKNQLFILNEKKLEKDFFDTIESKPLTIKQQDAVLVNENNNLILAGAGSGKSSVVVAKVCYLIKKEVLHPNEILILAFNKNAQEELQERFEKKNIKVQIKTFHSFGLSIIGQSTSRKFDLCPMTESQNNMNKFVKDTIFKLMTSLGTFLKEFTNFIAYFNIPYKNESEFNSLGEYYDYQKNYDMKSLQHEVLERTNLQSEDLTTLKEETVKSYQELVICNFLTLNGIKYLYEEPYKYSTWTVDKRQYKPDLYLPDYDIYIEHFGIDRNNKTAPYINNKEYLDGIEWKRRLHQEKQTTLVETFSYEFTENTLLKLLKEKLLAHNVIFRELNEAEIVELLKEPIENSKFTKLFTTFLNHFKSNRYTLDDIKEKSKGIERTGLFVKLFELIFKEYQEFQKRNNCIDFDDMIVEALNIINQGKYSHNFKHIFIDEFQDISTTRAMLIQALLPLNNTSITAVGDDWQSINRFAGSNIKIIQDFEKTFGISKTVALDYTFRFDNIVSDVASDFVQKNPNQLKKEIKTIKNQDSKKFSICLYWTTGKALEDLDTILNLIVKKEQENNKSVMILARYNFLLKDLNIKKYPTLKLSLSSVHGSKGNEADYVIILNIDNGKFGFPSKIEDDPILNIVVSEGDDFEDAEERRLFYVALTRTKGTIFLLSNLYNKSIFIEEVMNNYKEKVFVLNDSKVKPLPCPECKTGILKKNTTNEDRKKHFYGCSNYPRCKYTENVNYCPKCDNETAKDYNKLVAKCISTDCDFESALCIKCNGYMIRRNGQFGDFLGCVNYPKCKYSVNVTVNNTILDNPF